MKIKLNFILLLFFFNSAILFGSGFDVYVTKPNGGVIRSLCETPDGGFILCGQIASDFYFECYNPFGQLIWTKQFNDTSGALEWFPEKIAKEIAPTNDGGYIFVGTAGIPLDAMSYVGKLDSAGNLISRIIFSGDVYASGDGINKTKDSTYIITFHDYEGAGTGFEGVVKIDDSLNIIWSKEIGYGIYTLHGAAVGLDNSVYLFLDNCGACFSGGYWWAPGGQRLDSNGISAWTYIYGQSMTQEATFDYSYANAIAGSYDHGMLICGLNHETINEDVSVSYIDNTGDSLWTKRIGSNLAEQAFDVKQLPDSGYIITGYISDSCFTSEKDCMLMRLDKNADSVWTKSYSGYPGCTGKTVQRTQDGGFLVFCTTDTKYRIFKTDSAGNLDLPYRIYSDAICPAYCLSDTATLTVQPSAASYVWSSGEISQSIQTVHSGYYWVDVMDTTGFVAHVEFGFLNFVTNSSVFFTQDTVDACVIYHAQSSGINYPAYNYQWFKNDTAIVSAIKPTLDISEDGMYKLVSRGPCDVDSDSFYLRIHTNPVKPDILPNHSQYFCSGDSVIFYTTFTGYNYQWYNASTNNQIPGANTSSYIAYHYGSFQVEIIDSFGCKTKSDYYYAAELASDTDTYVYVWPLYACPGDSIGISTCCFINYLWNTGDTTSHIFVTQPGTYYCVMNNNTSCVSISDTITLPFLPVPMINLGNDTVVCKNSSLQLLAGPASGLVYYTWSDSTHQNVFNVNTSVTDSLGIFCEIMASNGCKVYDTIQVIVDYCSSIGDVEYGKLTVSPNPASDKIFINDPHDQIDAVLYNVQGKVCKIKTLIKPDFSIDINDLQPGIYYLKLIYGDQSYQVKLLKI